jgi:hypothetical protein
VTGALRLFQIEARRSIALWFAPALAVLVIWGTLSTMRPDDAPTLWHRGSTQFGLMCVVAAFIMCGVGAWTAGRDRRRQVNELVATTPRPTLFQDVALLASTIAWGLIGCVLAAAFLFVAIDRKATWGDPVATPVVVGLLTVVTGTAAGYLGGALIPGRFAAPLVAVAFSGVVLLVGTRSTAVAYLSPMSMDPRGISPYDLFYRPPSIPVVEMSLWLAGLTGCAIAITAFWRRRTLLAGCWLAIALVMATGGAVLVTRAFVHPPWERIYPGQPLAAYEPACVERAIPICVHPAYEARLQDIADRIGRLVEPLVGVPGGPVRAEQMASREVGMRSDGTLEVLPGPFVVPHALYDLMHERDTELNRAQLAIAFWLINRAGENASETQLFVGAGQPDAEVAAAVERFSALSPDDQRAWLVARFQDLRAGRVGIDELP